MSGSVTMLESEQNNPPADPLLGVGACCVGSLEAGKKRTRRSRKKKTDLVVVPTSKIPSEENSSLIPLENAFARHSLNHREEGRDASLLPLNNQHAAVEGLPIPVGNEQPSTKFKKKKRVRPKKKEATAETLEQGSPAQNHVLPSSPRTPKQSPRRQSRKSSGNNGGNSATKEEPFSPYLPEEVIKVGLERKHLIESTIRINAKSYTDAYVTSPDKGQDILIDGLKNRNRALEGDDVVVQLFPPTEWKKSGKDIQKTGTVVFIRHKVHPRVAVGVLKPMADRNTNVALFSPRDSRVPRIRIPIEECPPGFIKEHKKYEKQLFLASIKDWNNTRYATGTIIEAMGIMGDLKAENTSILLENDLNTEPYTPEMYTYFPSTYTIGDEEIAKRLDLRKQCIFTIDPATARDLDDAMSCTELPNGNLEIGVHISDVSFFVKEGTPFDAEVASRATSTYLVDTVYHMLPRELCMMCSLLPGEDKLAYSVFWEIDSEAKVVSHRFTRSVINSCVQLSYEHAQEMLEKPSKQWMVGELPEIHGGFGASDLSRVVNHLHRLAVIMRARRFEGGALRIDQPKLVFSLDRETGLPVGFSCYVNKEAHRLIEEFMLLANMTVAERIFADFPRLAFLRAHDAPHGYLMDQLKALMESYGVHLDVSSAGALHASMKQYDGQDFPSQARMMVLYARCSKPMARAKYFCTCGVAVEDFSHYALNVPLYTHFTSPIRRYPDVMVHRLLSASLGYCEPPKWEPDQVQRIASNCNKKKFAAKRAGEQSSEVYLSLYIGKLGHLRESAVVIDVKDRSFDVIICSTGTGQRIYTNKLAVEMKHINRDGISKLEITWLPTEDVPCTTTQTIEMFAIVTVLLTKVDGQLKVESQLIRPSISGSVFKQVKI